MGRGEVDRTESARAEAQRRQHASADPEHLLFVVLDEPKVQETFLQRGIDPLELRERLETWFASRAQTGGYRDGAVVASAAALERVLGRLTRKPWLALLGRDLSVVDALMLERSIAQLVFDLRRGDDFRHVLERARALAVLSGHDEIGVTHVLRALVDVRSFVATLARAGGSWAPMREELDAVLRVQREVELRALPVFDHVLRETLSCSRDGAYSGAPPLSIRELCLELARQPEASRFWTAAGILAADFTRAVHVPDLDARRD